MLTHSERGPDGTTCAAVTRVSTTRQSCLTLSGLDDADDLGGGPVSDGYIERNDVPVDLVLEGEMRDLGHILHVEGLRTLADQLSSGDR